jgi:importin subunit beta-1
LGGWPDLIRIMLENISTDNVTLKQSTLQAIGYVCEATVSESYFSSVFIRLY